MSRAGRAAAAAAAAVSAAAAPAAAASSAVVREASTRIPVLEARDLEKRFGKLEAVRGLSLSVFEGELYGLVGPDGAGKSTTIRMLTGLMAPSKGEALVLGQGAHQGSLVREAIGYMPQQYSLYGDLSVHENLRFFGRLFGLGRKDFAERQERLLHITRLGRFSDRRADALSGGMYKKLALACALLHRPKVLVLDEPTNGVDPVSRRELWDLLYELVGEGMAVLLATPYMDEAARCHRVGLLHEGRILTEGAPAELVARFGHRAFVLRGPDRQALEEALGAREDLLALTPHGGALRGVVHGAAAPGFLGWATACPLVAHHEEVKPDFEDLFLALMAERRTGTGTAGTDSAGTGTAGTGTAGTGTAGTGTAGTGSAGTGTAGTGSAEGGRGRARS